VLAPALELFRDGLGGRRILRDRPRAAKPIESSQPKRRVGAVELRRDGRQDPRDYRADAIAGRDGGRDFGEGGKCAGNRN